MKNRCASILCLAVFFLTFPTGCAPETKTAAPSESDLTIDVLYPTEATEVEMGQSLKSIIKVSDEAGGIVQEARVTLSVRDPAGQLIASIPAAFGNGDVYRTNAWAIPHKMQEGVWTITVDASTGAHRGAGSTTFQVNNSISEMLLQKYGFWVDRPALRDIDVTLVNEQGDAHNGSVRWGGVIPAQHIFPESWLEVQWREGDFKLETADEVREFFLNVLGNPGVYWTRSLESFERTKFKNWEAWKVEVRGQLSRYDEQWMIFHVPEVNKTYSLGTTVVLPPTGIDPHDVLRQGFEVHPEIPADGTAPKPLPDLLPPVELVSPEPGSLFLGTDRPVVLTWQPARDLTEDEYYLVSIDFNYVESNPAAYYAIREPRFVVPESFYHAPNCGIFNWQVTRMRQTGVGEDGQPKGEPISYRSLYWYLEWRYPPGEQAPFKPLCLNQQY